MRGEERYNESLMDISCFKRPALSWHDPERGLRKSWRWNVWQKKRQREREYIGQNNRDRKKTERERKDWGEVLKGPPRVSSITQAPQQSLFLSGMTLSSVLSLHWVNRIIALNNYTDIPGKSVLSGKSNSSDESPMVQQAWKCAINVELKSRQNTLFFSLSVSSLWLFSLWRFLWWADQQSGKHTNRHRQATCVATPSSLHHSRCQRRAGCFSKESMGG